jgi:hypothetical protein
MRLPEDYHRDLVLNSSGLSSWQGVLTGMVAAALEPELK